MKEAAIWDTVRLLVRKQQLISALDALEEWLKIGLDGPNKAEIQQWIDELILHSASVAAVHSDSRKGIITKEHEDVQLRQIARSILSIVNELEGAALGMSSSAWPTGHPAPLAQQKKRVSGVKRVLILAANAIETERLQLDEEVRIIKQRLEEGASGREYRIESEWAVRPTDLSKYLLQYEPTIVHFSGHGSPTGDIVLLDDNGKAAPLALERLAHLFSILKGSTECVVLNACYSAERAALLAECVGCVVGMEKAIGDPSALRFSAGFYRGIAFGRSYDDAFELGCNEIDLVMLPDSTIPQYVTRAKRPTTSEEVDVGSNDKVRASRVRTWVSPVENIDEPDRPDTPRLYPVWFATDRQPVDSTDLRKGFSTDRAYDSSRVYFGICHVAIPKSHKFGSVGSAWWKRFTRVGDDRLRVNDIQPLDGEAFWLSAGRAIAERESSDRTALIFIHGFRTTFEEAAIRAAQFGFDLKVPGITAFYSWASKGRLSLFDYTADEATIDASAGKISDFLEAFARQTGAERIHVIAHSMGNRGLLRAMERIIARAARFSSKLFQHIVFAAPDVDTSLFCELVKGYRDIAQHATLYVSSRDRAVGSSGIIHDAPRAGFAPPVTLVDGMDTIEVSNVDLTLLGHGYYGAAEGVLYDLRELLVYDAPAKARTRLNDSNQGYWQIGK